jgi:sulfur relay (sulfurtransferase) DsrF/TusC family protein
MAKSICIVVRKAPYGSMDAAEAVRHINGALSAGLDTRAVLTGDGVYLAVPGQRAEEAGWTSLSEALRVAVSSGAPLGGGAANRPRVCASRSALEERGIELGRVAGGIEVLDDAGVAELITGSDATLLF